MTKINGTAFVQAFQQFDKDKKGGTIMDRKRYIKILVVMAIAIIILVCDIVFSIKQEVDYEQRKESR